jgi:hypothetical protein
MKAVPTKHTFFDASVYLGLYGLPPKDLRQVAKLVELVEAGHLVIYLTSQVKDEFRRRRAGVIDSFLKPLEGVRLRFALPHMARETADAKALMRHVTAAETTRAKAMSELRSAAIGQRLPADVILTSLFGRAKHVDCTQYLQSAATRRALGNPPGKKAALGDAVSWEALLDCVQERQDLCFVSSDSDFASALDAEDFDEFLAEEWRSRRRSEVRFFRGFRPFLEAEYPRIHLATDVWKHLLIESIARCESFESTHVTVDKLSKQTFTLPEAERLLDLALENDQVRWIARDGDVSGLIERIIQEHEKNLPVRLVAFWRLVLGGKMRAFSPAPTADDLEVAEEPAQ